MQVVVIHEGKEYRGVRDKNKDACDTARYYRDNLPTSVSLFLELENGDFLVLANDALKRAVIIVRST